MLSDGELMTATCQDVDKVMFHAAQLSLGALGVIVSLKLQCEPAFNLEQVQYSVPLKDVRDVLYVTRRFISKGVSTLLQLDSIRLATGV